MDGFALPIKQLKGTDPVNSLDFSWKGLGVASAIVISALIGVNASLTSIDLSYNRVGPEGSKCIAEGIAVCASLTQVLAFQVYFLDCFLCFLIAHVRVVHRSTWLITLLEVAGTAINKRLSTLLKGPLRLLTLFMSAPR